MCKDGSLAGSSDFDEYAQSVSTYHNWPIPSDVDIELATLHFMKLVQAAEHSVPATGTKEIPARTDQIPTDSLINLRTDRPTNGPTD